MRRVPDAANCFASMVLISMRVVPPGEAVSALALPQRISCTAEASGPINSTTSACGTAPAAESTRARSAAASSGESQCRLPMRSIRLRAFGTPKWPKPTIPLGFITAPPAPVALELSRHELYAVLRSLSSARYWGNVYTSAADRAAPARLAAGRILGRTLSLGVKLPRERLALAVTPTRRLESRAARPPITGRLSRSRTADFLARPGIPRGLNTRAQPRQPGRQVSDSSGQAAVLFTDLMDLVRARQDVASDDKPPIFTSSVQRGWPDRRHQECRPDDRQGGTNPAGSLCRHGREPCGRHSPCLRGRGDEHRSAPTQGRRHR
jgi:hypothetical protein